MPKSRAPLFAGVAIVAILAGVMAAQLWRERTPPAPTLLNGTVLSSPRAVPDFQLVDSNGSAITLQQLRARWNVVFFGYTSCPDICPTTLSTLAQVEKLLSDLPTAQRPQMVFVSVDPKRDTPAQVGNYTRFFSPSFIGLTGESTQIESLTRAMGVPVAIHDSGDGAYTVDHAATLFLLDPQARMTAVFSPPHAVEALAKDLRTVILSTTTKTT
ncbi:MAG: SCO family protein [Steroidobacteraceae bacterium]